MATMHEVAIDILKEYQQPLTIDEVVELAQHDERIQSTSKNERITLRKTLLRSIERFEHTERQRIMRIRRNGKLKLALSEWKKRDVVKTRKSLEDKLVLDGELLDIIIYHYNLIGATDISIFVNNILREGIRSYVNKLE